MKTNESAPKLIHPTTVPKLNIGKRYGKVSVRTRLGMRLAFELAAQGTVYANSCQVMNKSEETHRGAGQAAGFRKTGKIFGVLGIYIEGFFEMAEHSEQAATQVAGIIDMAIYNRVPVVAYERPALSAA